MSKRVASVALVFGLSVSAAMAQDDEGLWSVYDDALKGATSIPMGSSRPPSRCRRGRPV
jgi:hypothetical protein